LTAAHGGLHRARAAETRHQVGHDKQGFPARLADRQDGRQAQASGLWISIPIAKADRRAGVQVKQARGVRQFLLRGIAKVEDLHRHKLVKLASAAWELLNKPNA
jgi:hypothetical protein